MTITLTVVHGGEFDGDLQICDGVCDYDWEPAAWTDEQNAMLRVARHVLNAARSDRG